MAILYITIHVFPVHSKKEDTNHAPHNLNTTPTLEFFLGTQTRWSRNSASIHSGLPGKPHQDAKTCRFSQVLGGFALGRWDWGTSNLITGQCGIASSSQNVSKMSGTVFENSQDACQTWKMDTNGIVAPFQLSPCIFWLTILDISTNPPSQS